MGEADGQAFIWSRGSIVMLPKVLGMSCAAFGVNDAGQVVGICGDLAVLWTRE